MISNVAFVNALSTKLPVAPLLVPKSITVEVLLSALTQVPFGPLPKVMLTYVLLDVNNALDAVVEFSKINNKIIILVGHGLLDIIPKNTIILTKEQLTKMD